MENISILSDFSQDESQQYYKKIGTDTSGLYTIHTGGNYVYICNANNKAIRFTDKDLRTLSVTQAQIDNWMQRIHKLFPAF